MQKEDRVAQATDAQFPPDFFIDLDRSGPIPLYFQVTRRIEAAITSGELPPGSWIENEVSLSKRLGLSRPTVRRAIQELAEKGLIVRRRGVGTQVVQGPGVRRMALTSLYEDLASDGRKPSTRLLGREVVPAPPDIAERLGIAPGDPVLHLRRLRLSNDKPVALMENYLSASFDGISDEQLTQRGLYQLIRARGITMKIARQRIGARRATAAEKRLLDIYASDPVLTMDRVTYDTTGAAIEVGHHVYRPDLYSIEVTLVDR
ncbi:MAG: GntR family transcriptional regulator [Protaetiibacter sp.]